MLKLVRCLAVVLATVLLGFGTVSSASADASFDFDLSIVGGGTVVGHLMLDPSFNVTSYDVVTSGALGFDYNIGNGSPTPFFSDGNLYLSFTRPGTGGYLVLEFTDSVTGNGSFDLKFAGSFECVGGTEHFALGKPTPLCSGGTRRQIVTPADVVVPEPASVAILGSGLLLVAGAYQLRRRRRGRP